MPESSRVFPQLTVLKTEQILWIHQRALQILAKTGVRLDSNEVIRLFVKAAGQSLVDENRVRIPHELVEWALKCAPSDIQVYDRLGNPAFRLRDGRTHFGIGVTTLFYQEPQDDSLTPFARRHMQAMVRLGSALPHYQVISTVGVVQDVPPHLSDLYASLEMFANTTKPLVLLVSDEQCFPLVIEMFDRLHTDLARKPFVIPYFNPVTPLVMNRATLEKMRVTIRRGLPLIFSNYSMAGMSTPITPAGTLALLLAELLAGLVISQLMHEGTPVILGILPAFFDMKTMVNFYDPQSILLNLACAEMMAYYHLPHCGTSGSGNGWGPDLLAAETYWMNHITACMSKVGLAPFVGDTLTSKAFSPVNVVYAHEIIDQALRLSQGFSLDETSLALDEIDRAGPGGSFLSTPSTMREFRHAYYQSPLFPRLSLEKWQAQGRPSAGDLLRVHTLELLEDLPVPSDHAELLTQGEDFIQSLPRHG
jgi:trimethylamine--corrinoid protein Co-methyltransferase